MRSNDETLPQLSCQNVKNGLLRPQGLHPGSTCLEGGWGRGAPNALREARCNHCSETRTTTSSLVDSRCLAASLSAGHHQERLFGWPLWPLCGFKFHFEEWLVPSNLLMRKLQQKAPPHLFNHLVRKICLIDCKLRFSLPFFKKSWTWCP